MTGRQSELEAFKTIDLRTYAADALGYELDAKASSPSSALMRGPRGNKIVIAVDRRDGHYVWFEVGGDTGGSIIDLAQAHGVGSLGEVRKALRPYIGQASAPPRPGKFGPPLRPVERDTAAVQAQWLAMDELDAGLHPYLNQQRGLTPETLDHPLFRGRIRIDSRGNAAFAHLAPGGDLVGFELKNRGFTGFAKGGRKTAFVSRIAPTDAALVIAESAIDAMSYAQMFGCDRRRFLSLGGQVSPEQLELVTAAATKAPSGAHVLLVMDNDPGGRDLAEKLGAVITGVGRRDLSVHLHMPPSEGLDWNDALRERLDAGSPSPPPPSPG